MPSNVKMKKGDVVKFFYDGNTEEFTLTVKETVFTAKNISADTC